MIGIRLLRFALETALEPAWEEGADDASDTTARPGSPKRRISPVQMENTSAGDGISQYGSNLDHNSVEAYLMEGVDINYIV